MKLPQKISFIIVVLTFLLILLGGMVHNTGSSLACPDWPLCYGQVFPEMKGGVAVEHSHRLLASAVAFLSLFQFIYLYRKKGKQHYLTKMGFYSIVIVLIQSVLGGITVIYLLPTAISSAHLGLSMLFLSLLFYIFLNNHNDGRGNHAPTIEFETNNPLVKKAWIAFGMVWLQIVLGALVKHTGSSLACMDIPFCAGALWPSGGSGQMKLQMLHRIYGVLLAMHLVVFSIKLLRQNYAKLKRSAVVIFGLLILQMTLGFLSVVSLLQIDIALAHLGVGSLLLLSFVFVAYYANDSTFTN